MNNVKNVKTINTVYLTHCFNLLVLYNEATFNCDFYIIYNSEMA
jgi:hypothetical protein